MRLRVSILAALLALAIASPAAAGQVPRRRSPPSTTTGAAAPRAPSLRPSPFATSTAPRAAASTASASAQATIPEAPVPVALSSTPLVGRHLSSDRVLRIAQALPKMRALRRKYPGSFGDVYLKGPVRWQVSFFSRKGAKEIGLVIVADETGRVLEQWTGFQVAWTMARGYPGAFGEHVNALYIWLPLCLLFFVPFFDWRHPLRLLHLDLLVLLSFSVSLAFFNHAHIYASVPLTYPPLLYLLARMLALLRRRARAPRPLRLLVPVPWLALGVVFLLGFRIALNVTDGNVIDVGYAGVIGASKLVHGEPLYGHWPADNEHGDTYGPVAYEAYVPFEQIFGWSGTWDDLPAAHAAAIFFDLLALALLFLIGRRLRGPTLGIVLAYAWVSYPFTLFALESDSNDTLVAVLVLAALLAASHRPRGSWTGARGASRRARAGRGPTHRPAAPAAWSGALTVLAGLTKFAPFALAPLLATDGLPRRRGWVSLPALARSRAFWLFALAFVLVGALVSIPAFTHDSLHTIFERTIVYQANRNSPFSVWGLYGHPSVLHGLQLAVQLAAVALALALAVVPRRADLLGLAAACAAVLIAVQLGIEHWFYLYIPWFFGLVIVSLFGNAVPTEAGGHSPSARIPVSASTTPA